MSMKLAIKLYQLSFQSVQWTFISGQVKFSTVTTESNAYMKLDFDYKIISAQLSVSTVDLSGQVEFSTVTTESNEYEIRF